MNKKVFITSRSFGQVSDRPLKILSQNNIEYDFKSKPSLLEEKDFLNVIDKYDALIVGADKITEKVIEKGKNLKIICKHGTGVDNIDLNAAKKNNVCVTNVAGVNSDAVADTTFGLIIDIARRLSYASNIVKCGEWTKVIGVDVHNKTLGIIGFGAIGKKVAKRALGFDMKVIAYDPFINKLPDNYDKVQLSGFQYILKNSDFLTLHIPLNKGTRNLIDEPQMSIMKKGSFIINASRGGIINEDALYKNIINGHLAGAGLDVVEKEPAKGNPLLKLDNVVILPHIASYSKEAIDSVSTTCSWNVVKKLNNETPGNIIV